jgi:NAD(P)-dependent dehydrogenase (short-subunit alcohol dehydrogenase family)
VNPHHRNPVMPGHLPGGEAEFVVRDYLEVSGMSDQVAIVAGAGGELGQTVTEKLSAAGFTVAGMDRSEEAMKALPDGVRRLTADPSDPSAARSAVDRIAAEVGSPAVLVNTIGMYRLGDALATEPEDLRLMIDVNLGAALWLTQAVVPYLRERGSGAIVHVAARPGLEPTAGMAAYAVSKAALVHLTRVLDLELRPLGIRVNAVAPQLIDTAKTHPYLTPDLLPHAVTTEAVADIIAYLVSDAAAPVSGAVVPAYGG